MLLSPRTRVRLPSAEIEIPTPGMAPARVRGSLWLQLLPVIFAALGMAIILLVGAGQGGGMMIALLAGTLLLVGGGAVVSIVSHRSQQTEYRREARQRIERYYAMLTATRDRIDGFLAEQQALLLEKDPEPSDCVRIASDRASRLWERSPDDPDFLHLRVGLGAQPSSVPIRSPRQPDPLTPDPLVDAAEEVTRWGSTVWGVPVFLDLTDGRSAGVCGERASVLETVRAVLIQLATHHAPDEVKVVAVLPPTEYREWAWLRWLPHTWSDDRRERFVATTPADASRLSKRLEEVLGRRRQAEATFGLTTGRDRRHLPVYVFLIADEALAENMPVLTRLHDPNAPLGASSLFLATDRTRLPRTCRTIVDVARGVLTDLDSEASTVDVVAPDRLSMQHADCVGTALAALRPRRIASATGLPTQVTLLDLWDVHTVEEFEVLERWRRSAPEKSLAVPIGVRPGGETLRLDLHQTADGPHGLLAGSTGSGKSALMQSLLLGLATSFHPHDLVFVLVDYKGGSTAGALQQLPHLIGTITNLDGNLAPRALVALQADVERRQTQLAAAGCDDLDTYMGRRRRGEPLEPLPHLVLVVDEFAELKTERPDFIHQLVRIARVGRSVGVHLILATQKPRAAVDDEIWANARFRVCLRVEQAQDSQDVIKRPDAASLVGRGQGFVQVGHDEVFTRFLGAWSGAAYRPSSGPRDPHEIVRVDLDGSRRAVDPTHSSSLDSEKLPTEAEALADYLDRSAASATIARLDPIWLAPLPDHVVLADLVDASTGWDGAGWRTSGRWVEPVLGQLDDPAHRHQPALRVDLPRAGNLAVYGAPGSGKTTTLMSLALALAADHTPADLQMYLLDFGGQSLVSLRDLPHVGGVVLGDEAEKLTRLLRRMLAELARRKVLFGEAGVATLPAYRAAVGGDLPAVVLLIDNLPALVHAYEEHEDELAQIAQQGGTLGIHMVISAASPSLVRLRMANSFSQAVALRLADRADYSMVLNVPAGYEIPPQPGRGLVKGRPTLECQVALPARGATEAAQSAAVRRLAHDMDAAWTGQRPWRVRTLPEHVPLLGVLPAEPRLDGAPVAPVGLAVDDLEPLHVDLRDGPHFAISGPPRAGKSTFLRTWLMSLTASLPPHRVHIYHADFTDSGASVPGARCLRDGADLTRALDDIEASASSEAINVLAIDDLDGLKRAIDSDVLTRLNDLAQARRTPAHVLLVGSSSSFASSYDGIGHTIKQGQTGFLIGGSDYDDLQVLGLTLPHAEASRGLPGGRGFYARRKKFTRVKVATPPDVIESPSVPGPPGQRANPERR